MVGAGSQTLSKRAAQSASKPLAPYFQAVLRLSARLWTPEDPEGNLIMAIAENRLSCNLLLDKLCSSGTSMPMDVFYYQDMRGIARLRAALAGLLQQSFMQGVPVDPDHIIVSSGCGAVLDNLFYTIADAGDSILILAPYYPAFDNDLWAKNHVVAVPVHMQDNGGLAAQLDAAAARAASEGHPARGLLLTNPNNPDGRVYPRGELLEMLRWCVKNGVHLISDEIYGNSIFKPCEFVSMAALVEAEGAAAGPCARDLVHVVFGLSKDWCASGLRVGALLTQNKQLHALFMNLTYFCAVPNHTQYAVAAMLEDQAFVADFLAQNARRLGQAYGTLAGALDAVGVPYSPAVGAMFAWVDLRQALTEPTWEAEMAFWRRLVDEQGLVITPGKDCHAAQPGFFRICYAWMPAAAIPVATLTDMDAGYALKWIYDE
ncbi:hypothetical protein WJX72_008020 [[Myrmecia] bisecta]|uniref:Aminotransferase class I/classII large domain-containing protein n=1 Tax=[Myrmecia] bisecta TaxID=41462 RepID=A0AAW1PS88_9CHLO